MIVKTPPVTAANAGCFLHFGLSKEGYIDTGAEIPGLAPNKDHMVLCVPCIAKLAKEIGYIPNHRLTALQDVVTQLKAEIDKLEPQAAAYQMFVLRWKELNGDD